MKGELCIGLWLQMMMVKPVKRQWNFFRIMGIRLWEKQQTAWKQLWYAEG